MPRFTDRHQKSISSFFIGVIPMCCFPLLSDGSSDSVTVPLAVVSSLVFVVVMIAVIVGAVIVRRKRGGRETVLFYFSFCLCSFSPFLSCWVISGNMEMYFHSFHSSALKRHWAPSNQIPNIRSTNSQNLIVSRLAFVFVKSIEARCSVETGDAATTSEWSTIVLPAKMRRILETWL